jgi:hypothetical protein
MNGTEIRQLNAEDAAEYEAVFLGALQSAPTAFAADYGEESARSSDQIAERFRREAIFGAFVDGTAVCHRNILAANLPKAAARRIDMEQVCIGGATRNKGSPTCFSSTSSKRPA